MTSPQQGSFQNRHIGPDAAAPDAMLRAIGVGSCGERTAQMIPEGIRHQQALDLPAGDSEAAYLRRLRGVAAQNVVPQSYVGMGYYDTVTPSVILRCFFETPGWYTPYTPYQ